MKAFRQVDRRLLTILLIVFVQILSASLILPILPLYAQRQFKMTPQVITLLVSSYFAAQFFAGPALGRLSDKYGRLPVLIVSQVGTVISFIMLAYAHTVWMLFAARILDGITGGNIIVAQAYVTDVTPPERRTQSLGLVFAAFGLGFIFGPAAGGVLSALFGSQIPFLIAAAVAALTVLITWWALDESLSTEQREHNKRFTQSRMDLGSVVHNTPLLFILTIAFVGQFALGLLQSTFALYGGAVLFVEYSARLTNLGVGLLLAVNGIGQFTTQIWLLPRLLRRYGDGALVIVGTLTRGMGMFVFALITTPWLGPIGSLLFAAGVGLAMPPLQSLSTRTVADELRGGVLGLYQSALSLSTILSTAVAGSLFAVHATTPYWLGGSLSVAVAVPAFFLLQYIRRGHLTPRPVPVGHS
ncbi:MAG: MFS transporter [Anaerolineales bacterium]|nr:MFS transporter [Anaerolineales bacterium]MCB8953165.1 MFS transporter [Ardenticatenales bacterium]